MYNNVYQDYINSILGTTPINQVNFENNNKVIRNSYYRFPTNTNSSQNDLTMLYPEIYKLLNPMIQSACMRYTSPLTEKALDDMVEDIYSHFTTEDATIININLTNNIKGGSATNKNATTSSANTNSLTKNTSPASSNANTTSKDQPAVQSANSNILRDLIKILIIKELISRQNTHPGNEFKFGSEQYGVYESPSKMYSNYDDGYNIFGY